MFLINLLLITITLILSLLHFYWFFGGTRGINNTLPENDGKKLFIPSKMATFIVAFGLLFLSLFSFQLYKANVFIDFEPLTYLILAYFFAFIFLLRAIGDFKYLGFFKRIKGSPFGEYDSKYYSPLCLVICLSLTVSASKYL